jgi:1,4-dihydroxy-2-naphthoate polyprenyltransferase
MLHASTIQLLRFHFSFFLLPVYVFALSQSKQIDAIHAILIFIILHLLVYPASNGYNSYMDRDTGPIGGIRSPREPTKQLYVVTIILDLFAILLSFIVSIPFAVGIALYIAASKAYSSRSIRLKRYPVTGYLVVVIFQGALVFYLVYSNVQTGNSVPYLQMAAASLLIGGFYPLTQVYQHDADKADGVNTLSLMLGYKGTFIFTAIIYLLAFLTLYFIFYRQDELINFIILMVALSPVLVYFFSWAMKVWKDEREASFNNTMRMNLLASLCINIAFLIILTRRFV